MRKGGNNAPVVIDCNVAFTQQHCLIASSSSHEWTCRAAGKLRLMDPLKLAALNDYILPQINQLFMQTPKTKFADIFFSFAAAAALRNWLPFLSVFFCTSY